MSDNSIVFLTIQKAHVPFRTIGKIPFPFTARSLYFAINIDYLVILSHLRVCIYASAHVIRR